MTATQQKPAKPPTTAAPPTALATPEQIERLRESTRQKIAAKPAKPPTTDAAGFSEVPTAAPPTALATPEQIERLRESTRQKIAELNAQGKGGATVTAAAQSLEPAAGGVPQTKLAAEEAKALAAQEKSAAKAKHALTATAFAPIPPPPTNYSATKETRLADLLKKYKTDEISPDAYHTERAKILAEP